MYICIDGIYIKVCVRITRVEKGGPREITSNYQPCAKGLLVYLSLQRFFKFNRGRGYYIASYFRYFRKARSFLFVILSSRLFAFANTFVKTPRAFSAYCLVTFTRISLFSYISISTNYINYTYPQTKVKTVSFVDYDVSIELLSMHTTKWFCKIVGTIR